MAIEGLKLAFTTDEMKALLTSAAEYHSGKADALERIQKEAGTVLERYTSTASNVRRDNNYDYSIQRHRQDALRLLFMRDHLIPDETYILDDHEADILMLSVDDDA